MSKFITDDAKLKFQRSLFPVKIAAKSTYQHGFLYPVGDPIETLPADTWDLELSTLTIMSTPIYPIMSNIKQFFACFNVPRRILWNHESQFCGEASDYGLATDIQLPTGDHTNLSITPIAQSVLNDQGADFGCAFGLIHHATTPLGTADHVSVLPVRAFMACYNEFFRNPNFCPKYLWDKDEYGYSSSRYFGTRNGTNIKASSPLPKVQKFSDPFVDCLPWQQRGPETSIPLYTRLDIVNDSVLKIKGDVSDSSHNMGITSSGNLIFRSGTLPPSTENVVYTSGLKNDLTNSVASSIKDLKNAILVDDLFTTMLRAPRYKDYLRYLFGEEVSDDLVDVPQFIGSYSFDINVDRVYQTTGYDPSSSSELGSVGASSVTGKKGKLVPHITVKEAGFLVIVTYFRHERSYCSGISPIYLKEDFLDFYQTPLAKAPDVPVSVANLFWTGSNASTPFGFNEYGWEYKKFMSTTRGMINPRLNNALDFVTLTDNFGNEPGLGAQFIEEDRTSLARCLTTGVNGIDYINDTLITGTVARVLPVYNGSYNGGM